MVRTEFTDDGYAAARAALPEDARRVLVVSTPSRRFVDDLTAALDGLEVEVFDQARVHVPRSVVETATARMEAFAPDAVITIGGGATTGLAKMLRLAFDFTFVALPTTYAASEMTSIWGTTHEGRKSTGRDPKVAPDLVVYDPRFTRRMPVGLTVRSLLNALAQPISAMGAGALTPDVAETANTAVGALVRAITTLAEDPDDLEARQAALRGTAGAGDVLARGKMGLHHKLAHFVGGRFDAEHASVHAILLPHSLDELRTANPEAHARIEAAAGREDLSAWVWDLLRRVEAPVGLRALDITWADMQAALRDNDGLPAPLLTRAWQGRRPTRATAFEDWGLRETVTVSGDLSAADTVVLAVHGRGSNADKFLLTVREIVGDGPAVVAVQAPGNAWYDNSYRDTVETIGEPLQVALREVQAALDTVLARGPEARHVLFGFSQGACLALEAAAISPTPLAGVVAIAGARIGPRDAYTPHAVDRPEAQVLVGVAQADSWVDAPDVRATAAQFEGGGARVTALFAPGDVHRIDPDQRAEAARLVAGEG